MDMAERIRRSEVALEGSPKCQRVRLFRRTGAGSATQGLSAEMGPDVVGQVVHDFSGGPR
jgi:hypothetical protein